MCEEATKDQAAILPPHVGMGGTMRLRYPYNEKINSFREWDHYHEPGPGEPDTLPSHRFWTWGVLNRPAEFPVGDCMEGNWFGCSQADLDDIFDCDKPIIDETIGKYLGAMHGIGNEPNYASSITAKNYAYQFHKYEQYIHSVDPMAQIMFGGITSWGPWEDWTIAFIEELQSYHTPFPDIWDIHPYVDAWPDGEASANGGIEFVIKFRAFLEDQGYGNVPMIFGEFGDPTAVNKAADIVDYAETFCDWIVANQESKNIIGWYWWGSSSVAMGNAGLFDANRNITPVGEAYIKHCGLRDHKIYMPLILK